MCSHWTIEALIIITWNLQLLRAAEFPIVVLPRNNNKRFAWVMSIAITGRYTLAKCTATRQTHCNIGKITFYLHFSFHLFLLEKRKLASRRRWGATLEIIIPTGRKRCEATGSRFRIDDNKQMYGTTDCQRSCARSTAHYYIWPRFVQPAIATLIPIHVWFSMPCVFELRIHNVLVEI